MMITLTFWGLYAASQHAELRPFVAARGAA